MPSKFIIHTSLLVSATLGVYLWLSSPFEPYTLQLVSVLILTYLGLHWLKSHKPKWFERDHVTSDLTILTAMILLLVSETGSLASPFFFLCYFLLFGVAMLYEIEATLVLTAVLVIYFMYLPSPSLTSILSLIMVTPLAIFTGHQYESTLEEKRSRILLSKHLKAEETDTLIFLSLNLKKTLLSAIDALSQIIPQEKVKTVQSNLKVLYEDLKNLYRSADELQQTIDKESDDR